MNKLKELFLKYQELITYIFIGGCTTVVNFAVYTVLIRCNADMTVSNAVAWLCAAAFSFIANKYVVFKNKGSGILKEAIMFMTARAASGAFEIFFPTFLFNIGVDSSIFGVKGAVAKIITSVIVIVANYVLSKFVIFKKNENES